MDMLLMHILSAIQQQRMMSNGGQGQGAGVPDKWGGAAPPPNYYSGQIINPNPQNNYMMQQYDPQQNVGSVILRRMYPQNYKPNT